MLWAWTSHSATHWLSGLVSAGKTNLTLEFQQKSCQAIWGLLGIVSGIYFLPQVQWGWAHDHARSCKSICHLFALCLLTIAPTQRRAENLCECQSRTLIHIQQSFKLGRVLITLADTWHSSEIAYDIKCSWLTTAEHPALLSSYSFLKWSTTICF